MSPSAPEDTIYALSSGGGRSAVAVIRLSGPDAAGALEGLSGPLPPPREARLRALRVPDTQELLDRALVLWFPAPASFTGEDCVELHLHGSQSVVAAVLRALSGMERLRAAGPGDFTRRAFDNDRLDLTEVEGLADLIDAQTEVQRRQAQRQFDGALTQRIEHWRDRLIRLSAHVEAAIDFSEEEIPETLLSDCLTESSGLRAEMEELLATSRAGERIREGIYIALLGAPNAGKSSLLNALAKREAAIVSEIAGTTRDVIEVALDISGFPVILGDTAGLRGDVAIDPIEAEGMRRSRERAAQADLKLVLFDGQEIGTPEPGSLQLLDDKALVLITKKDLVSEPLPESLDGQPAYALSVISGEGVEAFLQVLERRLEASYASGLQGSALLTRERHREGLKTCIEALARAEDAPEVSLMAEDFRHALTALGRLTGRVDVEDLLDVIFRDFCIGK
ncbi:tRNA uridine-5-carboxymethylaminomethyl(34) synthesis GTPase MnmE [Fodinicurvata halophila]|uniref:tRNA modification GTPase MnmE n=1 Tax=Fodinicurvata halophila TaxID=1419723 RepID=A0ABV8UNM0_9PROT